MTPSKTKTINGQLVEEFWWAGKYVVYIDHHATEETFNQAVARLTAENEQRLQDGVRSRETWG